MHDPPGLMFDDYKDVEQLKQTFMGMISENCVVFLSVGKLALRLVP